MIPVPQQFVDRDNGDCFRACLASITELDVPQFGTSETWFTDYFVWLGEHGWEMYTRPASKPPIDYSIGVIWSPTFNDPKVRHAVVAKNGELVYDPSPLRDEPGRVYGDWLYFVEVRRAAAPHEDSALASGDTEPGDG